jgi:hypothetical protein
MISVHAFPQLPVRAYSFHLARHFPRHQQPEHDERHDEWRPDGFDDDMQRVRRDVAIAGRCFSSPLLSLAVLVTRGGGGSLFSPERRVAG